MASLDRAFIRAFEPSASAAARRVPLSEAMAGATDVSEANENQDVLSTENRSMSRKTTEDFRPQLQVDSVAWPKHLIAPRSDAKAEFDRLIAGLLGSDGVRRSVLGVAGCAPGAGSTTLVLGMARQMLRQGLRLVLVDANAVSPGLAARVGLLPELGWEVVAAGRFPVAEVAVESIDDRLTLVPLGDAEPLWDEVTPARTAAVNNAMETLRRHYDVVLVDLGAPGCGTSPAVAPTVRLVGDWMDAAVLVNDVRSRDADALRRARSHLVALGISVAGVAENFVETQATLGRLNAA